MTNAVQLAQYGSNNVGLSFKNRVINGDFTIDQRNNGASRAIAAGVDAFTLDRWYFNNQTDGAFTVQQSSVAPAGFTNSLLLTVTTADSSLAAGQYCFMQQGIEGFNLADLGWGTANAKTITMSFWVRSSLTGTFGGSLRNNNSNRSYPFTYTISAANTFEYKTVTIAGDTTGTWLTNNGSGIQLEMGIGVGSTFSGTAGAWAASNFLSATGATNILGTGSATWYITGFQLEVGSVATSFDYLPFSTELQLCQRYYEVAATTGNYASVVCSCFNTSDAYCQIQFKVQKRASASVSISAFGNWSFYGNGSQRTINAIQTQNPSDTTFQVKISSAGTFPGGNAAHLDFNPTITAANGGGWTAAAEL